MTTMTYRSLALPVRAAMLLAAVAAVATGLLVIMGGTLAKPAQAQAVPPPTLTDEELRALYERALYEDLPDETRVEGELTVTSDNCSSESEGEGTISYAASGQATGPYPGTYTETGTFTVDGFFRRVTSFSAEFEITDEATGTRVTGTKSMPEGGGSEDVDSEDVECGELRIPTDDGQSILVKEERGARVRGVVYEATIETPAGTFADRGTGVVWVETARFFAGDGQQVSGEASYFVAGFSSDLSQPTEATDPVLTLPDDVTEEATGPDGAAVTFQVSATDETDTENPAVTCTKGDPPVAVSSGDTFPMGTTEVKCSAKDAAGNEATGSFDVTVQDTKGPEITVPTDKTVEAQNAQGAAVSYEGASATDAVDGDDVEVTCEPASGGTFPAGETTVTCSATDSAGNKASKSFEVTVQDTTEPTLDLPEDMTLKATGPDGAVATFAATASDLVDGDDVEVNCSPASGSTFPAGETTVNCSAKDEAGNEAEGSFKVNVTQTKVALDVKPRTCPNPLSTSDSGSYPVAIVGTSALDVSRIDTARPIRLEGVPAQPLSKGAIKDVATPFAGTIAAPPQAGQCTKAGADDKQDLNLKFDAQQVIKALGQVANKEVRVLRLTAYLKDGTYVTSEDVVVLNTTSTTKRK